MPSNWKNRSDRTTQRITGRYWTNGGLRCMPSIILSKLKPDVFFVSKIFGVLTSPCTLGLWEGRFTSVLWTTLDSLPILPKAIQKIAPGLKKLVLGRFCHTQSPSWRFRLRLSVALDPKPFFRLSDQKRFGPRKSLVSLIRHLLLASSSVINYANLFPICYRATKFSNKTIPSSLLGCCCILVGLRVWDIPKLLSEHGIPPARNLDDLCLQTENYKLSN